MEAANRGLPKELAKDMGVSAAAGAAKVGYAGALKQTGTSVATPSSHNGRGTTGAPKDYIKLHLIIEGLVKYLIAVRA